MLSVDLNCDMGEGMEHDAEIMPLITSANIACGAHAGNPAIMQKTVELALQHGVAIGAHPGFADPENFGRVEHNLPANEVYKLVFKQVESLRKLCLEARVALHHVKPHGALYNMAAKNASMANAIARAIADIDARVIVYGLSGSLLITEAEAVGLSTASEVFADRTYQNDGSLTTRSQTGALISNLQQSLQQVLQMIQQQTVTSTSGQIVRIKADTICLHGDGPHAVSFAKAIYQQLQQQNIHVKTI